MKSLNKFYFVLFFAFLFSILIIPINIHAQESRFTVVLDAGHGGHDPGATGSYSKEKDINLAVVLKLGSIIESKFKDVKVVYTRKTDKYLTLQERADVVNDHHADLFICIHTNSSPSPSAYGAETYTLGLAKTKSNLDVAMRENSVILLEDDYKSKYKGFDPNSVDSYIMFEFMQDKYIDKSIDFSSIVQKQFVKHSHRLDRGVRQAGFWVLHRSACPSVLVELGFISNPSEERYLNSENGQYEMASAIFNAFADFKHTYDKKSGIKSSPVSKIEPIERNGDTNNESTKKIVPEVPIQKENKEILVHKNETIPENIVEKTMKTDKEIPKTLKKNNINADKSTSQIIPVFKVQLFATNKKLRSESSEFKGLKNTDFFFENGFYKYTTGSETEYSKIEKVRKEVLNKFPQAFIIGFIGNTKLSNSELSKLKK
jgi:N-acetylmuramoyl-L-alanine amidase